MLLFDKKCPNCDTYHDPTLEQCPNCHKTNELYAQRDIYDKMVFLHPLAQGGLFLGGFAYVGMVFCQLFWSIFFGGIANEGLRNTLIVFFAYIMVFGGLLSITLITRRKSFISKFTRPMDYLYGLGFAGLLVIASIVVGMIVSLFHTETINGNQATIEDTINNYPIIAVLIVILLGPVCEELTYRVGLYSFLRRYNFVLAIIVTSLVFGFIHFDFEAADLVNELWALPSYVVTGAILCLAYEHRGPACAITAHMAFNLIAFLEIIMDK